MGASNSTSIGAPTLISGDSYNHIWRCQTPVSATLPTCRSRWKESCNSLGLLPFPLEQERGSRKGDLCCTKDYIRHDVGNGK